MASSKIKGITIEIGGDTTKLGKAIADSEAKSRSLQGELKQVEKLLKMDPGNVELLAQKQEILTRAVSETTDKLKVLKDAQEQVERQFKDGDIDKGQYRAFQREIIKTESELNDFKSKLDGTDDKIEDVGNSAENSSDGFTIMGGALADLVSNAIQSAISAVGDFIGALLDLSEATEEYRTMQAKLEGSALNAGESVEFAKSQYENFYKYLGDDQASTNAITNLMGLGTSTESLAELAEGATSAWTAYGDSINVESLTEAISETVLCSKVTGAFADTINWNAYAMQDLGTALGDNKDAVKAYKDALDEGLPVEDAFNEALAKITSEQERADVVARYLNTTFGESKKTYDELNKSVMDTHEAELELKDTQAQLGETVAPVNNALTDMKNQALEAIIPLVEKLAEAFVDLYNWLQKNPAVMHTLVAVAIALATAFTVLAGALAIQGIITGVTKAIAFLNTTLLANPIVLITALIAGLVAGFIYLWNNCEGFRNFWINLCGTVKTFFVNAWNAVKSFCTTTIPKIISDIVNWFKQLPSKIQTWLSNTINRISKWASNMAKKAKETGSNFVKSIINFFNTLPGKIGYALGFVLGKIILFGKNAISWVKTNVPIIINNIVNFFKQLPGKIWTWLVNVVNKIVTWGSNMKSKATTACKNLISSVVSYMKELPSKIYNAIKGAIDKIVTWGSNMKSKAKTAVSNVSKTIVDTLKSIPGKVADVGRNIVEGVWNGISNATSWIKSKVGEFARGILNGMKSALGIKSPSRVFRDEVGRYIAEGIGVGITDNSDSPINALEELSEDMTKKELAINGATINRKLATTFSVGSEVNKNDMLLSKLDSIYEKLGRLQVVLDTGILVGETIDKIDAGLATRQLLSARGV